MTDALVADRLGPEGDEVYAALMAAHDGLPAADSAALNARLILLLANAVGDAAIVRAAIERARRGLGEPAAS